jgi:hypothetical protein
MMNKLFDYDSHLFIINKKFCEAYKIMSEHFIKLKFYARTQEISLMMAKIQNLRSAHALKTFLFW